MLPWKGCWEDWLSRRTVDQGSTSIWGNGALGGWGGDLDAISFPLQVLPHDNFTWNGKLGQEVGFHQSIGESVKLVHDRSLAMVSWPGQT